MANNNHFNLTLDTLAPSGSITAERYYKQNGNVTIVKGDASFMKVWFNGNPAGSKDDAGYTGGTWEVAADSHATGFTEDGEFYFHLVLMDSVGNESDVFNSTITTFDTKAPIVYNVRINDGAAKTKTRAVNFKFKFTDQFEALATEPSDWATNKTSYYKIANNAFVHCEASDAFVANQIYKALATNSGIASGQIVSDDIDNSPIAVSFTAAEILAGEASRDVSFKESVTDGTHYIGANVTDNAGNTSSTVQDGIYLDLTAAEAVLILKTADGTATLPSYINYRNFQGVIDVESAHGDAAGYKIWGDITGKTSEPAEFTPVTVGTDPIVIDGLSFTTGDGTKHVYIRTIDDAGNIWPAATITDPADFPDGAKQSRVIDESAPSVVLTKTSPATKFFSNITGHTDVVIAPTVDASVSGIDIWQLKLNGTAIKNGTGTDLPTSWTLTSADGFVANQDNNITLYVRDKALNETTSTAIVVFLDTKHPAMKFSDTLQTWYIDTFDVRLEGSETGAGIDYVKVWANNTAESASVPSAASAIEWTAAADTPQTIAKGNIAWDLGQGQNYMHVQVVDKVGNAQIFHYAQILAEDTAGQGITGTVTSFGYDTGAPEINSFEFTRDAYPTTTAAVTISASDATSGVAKMRLWGDLTNGAASATGIAKADAIWEDYATSRQVILTTGDGIKTVYIEVVDEAGVVNSYAASHISESANDSAELDTKKPSANIQALYKNESAVLVHTNEREFVAHIWGSDDAGEPVAENTWYFMYGDFATTSEAGIAGTATPLVNYTVSTAFAAGTLLYNKDAVVADESLKYVKASRAITAAENTSWEAIAGAVESPWAAVVFESGKTYMKIGSLYNVNPDGSKTVNVAIKDNAGNVEKASYTFVFDTTAPVVVVSDQDYSRISKVHTLRRTNDGETAGKYNDFVNFAFTPDSDIDCSKVCVYAIQKYAEAVTDITSEAPIGNAHGSVRTILTSYDHEAAADQPGKANVKITAMINGEDYEEALKARALDFNIEANYVVGDIVKYNSAYYTCKVAHIGAWDATHFEAGVDGAHICVVYVQDYAGTWSAIAEFNAKL